MKTRICIYAVLPVLLLLFSAGTTRAAITIEHGLDLTAVAVGRSPIMGTWETEVIAEVGDMVMFSAARSKDIDYYNDPSHLYDKLNYVWMVDGEVIGTEKYATFIFQGYGNYTVTVTVDDALGNENDDPQTATVYVQVVDAPRAPAPEDPEPGGQITGLTVKPKSVINAHGYFEHSTFGERDSNGYTLDSAGDSWHPKKSTSLAADPNSGFTLELTDAEHNNSQKMILDRNVNTPGNTAVLQVVRDIYLEREAKQRQYGDLAVDTKLFTVQKTITVRAEIKATTLQHASVVGTVLARLRNEQWTVMGSFSLTSDPVIESSDWQKRSVTFNLPSSGSATANVLEIIFSVVTDSHGGINSQAVVYIDNVEVDTGLTYTTGYTPPTRLTKTYAYLQDDPDPELTAKRFDIVTIPHHRYQDVVNLKMYNPNIKVLLYEGITTAIHEKNQTAVNSNNALTYDEIEQGGWFLMQSDGITPVPDHTVPVDLANERWASIVDPQWTGYHTAWIQAARTFAEKVGVDGLFLDTVGAYRDFIWRTYQYTTYCNPNALYCYDTGTPVERETKWQQGLGSMLQAIYDNFRNPSNPSNLLLIGNFAESRWDAAPWNEWLGYLDGAHEEHGLTYYPDDVWIYHDINDIPSGQFRPTWWLKEISSPGYHPGKYYIVEAYAINESDSRAKLFGLASAMMMSDNTSQSRGGVYYQGQLRDQKYERYDPVYDVLSLGDPVSAAVHNGYLSSRTFENGYVFVNNNPITQVITLQPRSAAIVERKQTAGSPFIGPSTVLGWNIISLPAEPLDPDPIKVFSGIDIANWSLQYWRNESKGHFQTYGEVSGWKGPMVMGTPYWFMNSVGYRLPIGYMGNPAYGGQEIILPLPEGLTEPRWVQFGNMREYNVSCENIRFETSSGQRYTWAQAVQQGLINDRAAGYTVDQGLNYLITFDVAPGLQSPNRTILEPWVGYWLLVYTQQPLKIVFP